MYGRVTDGLCGEGVFPGDDSRSAHRKEREWYLQPALATDSEDDEWPRPREDTNIIRPWTAQADSSIDILSQYHDISRDITPRR